MKETVNVNIGSQAFTLDEDAYRVLRSYLDDIRTRMNTVTVPLAYPVIIQRRRLSVPRFELHR